MTRQKRILPSFGDTGALSVPNVSQYALPQSTHVSTETESWVYAGPAEQKEQGEQNPRVKRCLSGPTKASL